MSTLHLLPKIKDNCIPLCKGGMSELFVELMRHFDDCDSVGVVFSYTKDGKKNISSQWSGDSFDMLAGLRLLERKVFAFQDEVDAEEAP